MGSFRDLAIRVTNVDRRPVQAARVTAERDGRTVVTGATDERGRCELERDDDGELTIRVEADGLAADERVVSGVQAVVLAYETGLVAPDLLPVDTDPQ